MSLQLQSSSKVHIGKYEEQAGPDSSEKSPQSSVPSHTVTWSVHTPKNRRFQTQSNFTTRPFNSCLTVVTCKLIFTTPIWVWLWERAVSKAEVVQSNKVADNSRSGLDEQGEEIRPTSDVTRGFRPFLLALHGSTDEYFFLLVVHLHIYFRVLSYCHVPVDTFCWSKKRRHLPEFKHTAGEDVIDPRTHIGWYTIWFLILML